MTEQECKCCHEAKPIEEFYKHKKIKSGYDTRCKDCHKAHGRLRRALKKEAGEPPEVCGCCGERSEKTLVLDHCHETEEFRGWLCQTCNLAIGKLGDNIEGITRALNYLKNDNSNRKKKFFNFRCERPLWPW